MLCVSGDICLCALLFCSTWRAKSESRSTLRHSPLDFRFRVYNVGLLYSIQLQNTLIIDQIYPAEKISETESHGAVANGSVSVRESFYPIEVLM